MADANASTQLAQPAKPGQPTQFAPWRDPAEKPYVRIQSVTKRFGDFVAVDGVDLDIYKKELFCLLGASGCGKTTLLRMLAGFEQPDEGKIFIDGQDMTGVPAYSRPVNMMFQSYALFPHMSVEKNIAYGLKQDRVPRGELKDRVAEALDLVQLGNFAKRRPHQLSGGQRQRVALARALVKKPKLLLLDEPLAALDKKLRERTQFELMNIQDKVGVTFVVVTHDQEEAMILATRIAVMSAGKIVQMGTPTEIYEHPTTRFTADFIGSVNLFEGSVGASRDGLVEVESPGAGGRILVKSDKPVSAGQQVAVALRPEKIAIRARDAAPLPQEGMNRLSGTVRDVAYLGDISIFRVDVGSGQLVLVTQPNLLRSTEREVDWDTPVVLEWRPAAGVVLTE